MRAIGGAAERGPGTTVAIAGVLALLAAIVMTGVGTRTAPPFLAISVVLLLAHRKLLAWPSLVGLMILVTLFFPMRKYALPGSLPFALDPFRLLVAFVLMGWIASLMADPRVRFRRTGFEAPLVLVLVTTLGSVIANGGRASAMGSEISKDLTFLFSYLVVLVIIVSVIRSERQIDALIKVLVSGGAVVAGFAIVESRTQFNIFDHLTTFVPFLRFAPTSTAPVDMRGYRAFGSAQHPIALSAALVLLLPVAFYLVQRTGQKRWWAAAGLLLVGAMATTSRTSVIMLLVAMLVFVMLRPREMKRLWPALLPAVFLIHFALPGTIGTLTDAFSPKGGLIAQQTSAVGTSGQGRLADVGPVFQRVGQDPLFGIGYGTRRIGQAGADDQILDDQWLGTLLETGVPGVAAWLWLMFVAIKRFAGAARRDRTSRGWLLTALTASVASFGVGMFFYDTFAFIQVTLLFFFLLAFGSVLLAAEPRRRRLSA